MESIKNEFKKEILNKFIKDFPNSSKEILQDVEMKIDIMEYYESHFPNYTDKELERVYELIDHMFKVERVGGQ